MVLDDLGGGAPQARGELNDIGVRQVSVAEHGGGQGGAAGAQDALAGTGQDPVTGGGGDGAVGMGQRQVGRGGGVSRLLAHKVSLTIATPPRTEPDADDSMTRPRPLEGPGLGRGMSARQPNSARTRRVRRHYRGYEALRRIDVLKVVEEAPDDVSTAREHLNLLLDVAEPSA